MKFKQEFQRHLQSDGFPADWVDGAISYGKLKKCIKRVEKELASIGLDPATVQSLLRVVEAQRTLENKADHEEHEGPLVQYVFDKGSAAAGSPSNSAGHKPFLPKLLFAIDDSTGAPVDARLSGETKEFLHQAALQQGLTDVRITEPAVSPSEELAGLTLVDSQSSNRRVSASVRLVEVPLTADGEFFNILQREVSGLVKLQEKERKHLTSEIELLGQLIGELLAHPDSSKTRHDLDQWREIFDLYLQAHIFFAATERDRGARNYAKASENLKLFLERSKKIKFKKKESVIALQKFIAINLELLQSLQFQELNNIAISKIVKKFDKRTGLGVKTTLPASFFNPIITTEFAKGLSAQVSTQIISVVPRLDDYLCPICFSIAYRPIRLKCDHIFCIRCLITMQRDDKDRCPLCRQDVVMEADSANLDHELAIFLKKHFPTEVKIKQRENERAVAQDQFGAYYDTKCVVM